MKVLIVSTSENKGGAAVAANRLMVALRQTGIDASMLVRDKQTDNPNVIQLTPSRRHKLQFVWERLVIFLGNRFSRKQLFTVSIANTGNDITQLKVYQEADVIHLHWINQGMLSLKNLASIKRSGKPVVWTMHDMWLLTGICHYAYGCERFESGCGSCPFLGALCRKDLSSRVFDAKKHLFSDWSISLVAVSTWLANLALRSVVLKGHPVAVIPNAVPLDVFQPIDRRQARLQLNLPENGHLIVFGAAIIDSPVKGFSHVKEALKRLINRMDPTTLHLVVYGGIKSGADYLSDLPIAYTWLGLVSESQLPVIFSASDVLVAPSAYETFGQTLIEAQSCGCIPVCFGNSGQQDIIEPGVTGLFADYQSSESLADAVYEALTTFDRARFVDIAAKKVQATFSTHRIANLYGDQYKEALKRVSN